MAEQYDSFSQIDERLQILKLQRQIDIETIKLNLNRTKANLCPSELFSGAKGILQKILLTFAIKKLSNVSGLIGTFRRR